MAVISHAYSTDSGSAAHTVLWETITDSDTAQIWCPINTNGAICSIQFSGTWGGATVVLQQSNDGATWFTANDVLGTAVSATADAFFELSIAAKYVRPSTSGGSSSDVDATLILRG